MHLPRSGIINRVKKPLTLIVPVTAAITLTLSGCGKVEIGSEVKPAHSVQVEVTAVEESVDATFQEGVLTTPEVRVEITDYRVIQPGGEGNQYGKDPVLAIWYDTTNLGSESEDAPNPLGVFIPVFTAYQDNNPDVVNTLSVGMMPDLELLDYQTAAIKPGRTAPNAIAYVLTDLTTPVELAATYDNQEVGRMTFNLN